MIAVSPIYLSKVTRNEFSLPAEDKVRAIAKMIFCCVTGLAPRWLTIALATQPDWTRRAMPRPGWAVSLRMMVSPRTLRPIKAPPRAEACLPP